MSSFRQRYDAWREHNTDKYRRPWIRFGLVAVECVAFAVFIALTNRNYLLGSYMIIAIQMLLRPLVIDMRKFYAESKKFKPVFLPTYIIAGVALYTGACLLASAIDHKPAFYPFHSGDIGMIFFATLLILLMTLPYVAGVMIVKSEFFDKRRIKGVSKKKLFS